MNRYHDVRQLSKDELERAKRELQENLGLIVRSVTKRPPGDP